MPAAAPPIFGPATVLLVGLASQALQVRWPKVTCGEAFQARHDIGAQMGCSLRESWSRKAVRSMRICASLAPCQPSKSLRHLVNVISRRLLISLASRPPDENGWASGTRH